MIDITDQAIQTIKKNLPNDVLEIFQSLLSEYHNVKEQYEECRIDAFVLYKQNEVMKTFIEKIYLGHSSKHYPEDMWKEWENEANDILQTFKSSK